MTLPSQPPAAGDAASSAAVPAGAAAPGPAVPEVPVAVPRAEASDVRDARLAWLIGGSLLIAHAVLILVANGYPMLAFPGASLILDGTWAASLLVFAFGVRARGSVVARRPLGVVALVIAAAVPLLSALLWWVVPIAAWDATSALMAGTGASVLSLGALLVATVVIGRAGAVPHTVRWVPLIVLAVTAGAQVLLQVAGVAFANTRVVPDLTAAYFFTAMLGTLGVLLLGILAVVLAPRDAPRPAAPTQVYPPAS
ncbi:hypothetical protein [Microbacterium sp. NPDC058389]|uniref:hypothetical protein n=1 Tax=Microbacterium sp. NPDC058389 TaxID=3346475 RepID=UPI0036509C09